MPLFLQQVVIPDWTLSPIWTFISAVIALIAIFVPIYLYVFHQKKKRAVSYNYSYDYISNPLIEGVGFQKDKLRIQYDGKDVPNINKVSIAIWNSGNQPIKVEDFQSPLTINFGEKANILDVSGVSQPSGISVILKRKTDYEVEFEPLLLNPDDTLYIYFMVSRFTGDLVVNGRIVGIQQIKGADLNTKERTSFNSHTVVNSYLLFSLLFLMNAPNISASGWIKVKAAGLCGWALGNLVNLITAKKKKSILEITIIIVIISVIFYFLPSFLNSFFPGALPVKNE